MIAAREAKEQERKARKQAGHEASDERERRDCSEDAERVALSSLVELSDPNFVHFLEVAEAESSQEDIDVGCLTQREGLTVPTPKSKEKLIEERARSAMRVRWEGLGDVDVCDDLNAHTKQATSFVNTSSLSVGDQGHESTAAFRKKQNRIKQVKTAYGSSRETKTNVSSSSKNRTLQESCPVKEKELSDEFSGAKEDLFTYNHHHRVNADSLTDPNQLSSVERSACRNQTSSSTQLHIADDESRAKRKVLTSSSATSAHVKKILSFSLERSHGDENRNKCKDGGKSKVDGILTYSVDSTYKLLNTTASRVPASKLLSSSSLSKSVGIKRSSSSKNDPDTSHRVLKPPEPEEHNANFLAPSVSHTSIRSASSSRRRDEKSKSVHGGRALEIGVSSSRSSDSKAPGKKRSREPDLSTYTQSSGISSGERSSLANKSRRRKKSFSSIGAAIVKDVSQITKIKSQRALSTLGGGLGDYDFAF